MYLIARHCAMQFSLSIYLLKFMKTIHNYVLLTSQTNLFLLMMYVLSDVIFNLF